MSCSFGRRVNERSVFAENTVREPLTGHSQSHVSERRLLYMALVSIFGGCGKCDNSSYFSPENRGFSH